MLLMCFFYFQFWIVYENLKIKIKVLFSATTQLTGNNCCQWVHLVLKTRAQTSHDWAPLNTNFRTTIPCNPWQEHSAPPYSKWFYRNYAQWKISLEIRKKHWRQNDLFSFCSSIENLENYFLVDIILNSFAKNLPTRLKRTESFIDVRSFCCKMCLAKYDIFSRRLNFFYWTNYFCTISENHRFLFL